MNPLNLVLNLLTYKQMQKLFTTITPRKHQIYFVESGGLTQTEASHRANMIKEHAELITALFTNTAAYTDTIDFKGRDVREDNFAVIDDLAAVCLKEGEMYSLSSWLREAVKAKVELLALIKGLPVERLEPDVTLHLVFNEKMPNQPVLPALRELTEDDILGEWTIAERSDYLSLLSKASHLGKKIHNNGIIAKIRSDLHAVKNNSFKQLRDGAGYSTFVVTHTPLYLKESIDKLFFDLQEEHRSVESKLNWYKAKLANELSMSNVKIREEHAIQTRKVLAPYEKEVRNYHVLLDTFKNEQNAWYASLEVRRRQLINYISQLKIVIPKGLEHINAEFSDKK